MSSLFFYNEDNSKNKEKPFNEYSCELTLRDLGGTQRHGFIAPDHHKGEIEHSLCIWVPMFLHDQSY